MLSVRGFIYEGGGRHDTIREGVLLYVQGCFTRVLSVQPGNIRYLFVGMLATFQAADNTSTTSTPLMI